MQFLLSFQKRKRLPNLRAEDVHDVLIPLWLHKEAAAKDAAGRALRRASECLRLRHDWPLIAPLTGHSLATHWPLIVMMTVDCLPHQARRFV